MKYKIFKVDYDWVVYPGYTTYGDWVKEEPVFWSKSIADCYAWIKAQEEGLLG